MIASLVLPARTARVRRAAAIHRRIAAVTGPLDLLANRNVLVLADDDNLRCGARDLGYRLSCGRLARRLKRPTAQCQLHAFFAREPGDERRLRFLRNRGWLPHGRDIEMVWTPRGPERLANCDNDILFAAGRLAGESRADMIVLASGDGCLVCDLARNLREISCVGTIVTLSLAGSTSQRLNAAHNPYIDGNIEIGLDCLDRPPGWFGQLPEKVAVLESTD